MSLNLLVPCYGEKKIAIEMAVVECNEFVTSLMKVAGL